MMFYWVTFLIALILWTLKSGNGAKIRPTNMYSSYKEHISHIGAGGIGGIGDSDDDFWGETIFTSSDESSQSEFGVNPATGLTMNGMIDVGGNFYGTSWDSNDMHSSMDTDLFGDSLMSDSTMFSDSMWEDSFISDSFSSFDSNWDDSW